MGQKLRRRRRRQRRRSKKSTTWPTSYGAIDSE